MTTREELCEILDILHDFEVEGLGSAHPCLGCLASMEDPETCRGCADVDLCPSLHPLPGDRPRGLSDLADVS